MAKNDKSITGKLLDLGFVGELWQQVKLVFYLIKDREVPIYLKVLPFVGVLYTLFPIDIVTDFVPVLGQLDDLTILLIGAKVFIEMAPPQVVQRYMAQMRGEAAGMVVEGVATDASENEAPTPELKVLEGELVEDAASLKQAEKSEKRGLFRRQGK